MVEPYALLALAIDAAFGWPAWLYARIGHPVGGFARAIDAAERAWNAPARSTARRRTLGTLLLVLLVGTVAAIGWGVQMALAAWLGRYVWIGTALLAAPALAQRSLHQHVRAVRDALATGDPFASRRAVARIVGRDTARLDTAGVARAAIESLAESFCDGIVAPLFWLVLLGLPGIWAYKAINTADSLIGHREPRYAAFGWASARTDDGANWVPARLAGLVLCVAGGGGFATMRRDARRHASPNAGWPEAALAGVLGIRLAGPIAYDGVTRIKPWIGDGRTTANAADITRALQVHARACLILWAIAGVLAWVR